MLYWQAKRWMASSPHLCCCRGFIIRNGGAVWKGETETERIAAFFCFYFVFSFYFYEERTQQPAKRAGDVLVFTASRPLAVPPKTFYLLPLTLWLPPLPHSGPLTSPLLLLAPPPLGTFGFAFSFYFPLFFISNSLKAAIWSSAIFKITPGRWGNTPSVVPFPPHFPYLFAGVGLWNKSLCIFGGAVVVVFSFSFCTLVKNK